MTTVTTTLRTTRASEHTLELRDGTHLFYRAWLPARATDRAIIAFHRGHEHSGRLQDVVEELGLEDTPVFAWDARGHGRSPGERGWAHSFSSMVDEVDQFVRHVVRAHGIPMENIIVLGHSVGAVTVATWVHDYAPNIRAMVLATPALRIKLYVPFALPGLRLLEKLKGEGKSFIQSYVKAKLLTHDRQQAERYDADDLITRSIAVNVLLGLHDTSTRLMEDAGAIRVPALVLAGGDDWVVRLDAERRFFERLGSPVKQMEVFPGMYHDILHEKDRHLVLEQIRRFCQEMFERPPQRTPLLDAHTRGYTKEEYDRLKLPRPLYCRKRWGFAIQKLAFKTLGRLSNGLRLGWRTGFDSGRTLDYVYENRARGWLGIGKWFDAMYLSSPGWRGIRQRKAHVEHLLQECIDHVGAWATPVRVLDIATGGGRYVLDVLRRQPRGQVTAVLKDYSEESLETARRRATAIDLDGVEFEAGDAFDPDGLRSLKAAPQVVIVSGLYELYSDNRLVLRSLRAIASAMEPGGYLIYTGQPWHPQLEQIARVLRDRNGDPWIMRRRTQEELDELVLEAGFSKQRMLIDDDGIFTVSVAVKGADS